MKDCCNHSLRSKKCMRRKDKRVFTLPRKYSKKQCKRPKGFSKKSSCAPYLGCKIGGTTKQKSKRKSQRKDFLYNPDDPKKSFDVYIDKNPKDTISIKYKTVEDVQKTIRKLERLYKQGKYPHKRIWQVAMIMKVRLEVFKKKNKKTKQYQLAKRYLKHVSKRTSIQGEKNRKLFTFKI